MKRITLPILALSAALFTAGYVFGENKPQAASPASAGAKEQKLVKVLTLSTPEANREFQNNVQLVQAQRQALIELNAQMEKEKDVWKKAELKKKVDDLLAKLNENNDQMIKHYGFSLTRNYVMQIETASIYLVVNDEEAAKIEAEQKAQSAKK